MNQHLIQQLSAAAATIRQSGTSARIKNLAQQVDQATEALRLFAQISGDADLLATYTAPGIAWKDVPKRSVLSFGEHSRGTCSLGVFTIKLRDSRPFMNAYRLYFNSQFVCSTLSFCGAKENALKHYERLLRIALNEQAQDRVQLATLEKIYLAEQYVRQHFGDGNGS